MWHLMMVDWRAHEYPEAIAYALFMLIGGAIVLVMWGWPILYAFRAIGRRIVQRRARLQVRQ